MKTVKFSIEQHQANGEFMQWNGEFEMANDKAQLRKVTGTLLNRFFQFNALCKKCSAKGFKANDQVHIWFKVENENVGFNTDWIKNENIKAKLKVGQSAKSKRNFAKRVSAIIEFVTSGWEYKSLEELIEGLEVEMANN